MIWFVQLTPGFLGVPGGVAFFFLGVGQWPVSAPMLLISALDLGSSA